MKSIFATCLCTALLCSTCGKSVEIPPYEEPVYPETFPTEVENYNYSLGTQTIGATYGFTSDTRLVETAKLIAAMGSNILKTDLSFSEGYEYSHELLEREPSYKAVMEMNFKYYFFWVYSKAKTAWIDGFSEEESQKEYDNMYKLTDYLLHTYAETSREFYLGHWEGDWHLTDQKGDLATVAPERIQGMIDWYNIRQKAIDDARAANANSQAKVFQYCELNRVFDALDKGYDRIINKVLPYINVDYVSYSSYDAIASTDYSTLKAKLHQALNAIESRMKPKADIEGKRVFIGEYGFDNLSNGESTQNLRSRMVMKAALEWGCPFILYWEMYNNEITENNQQKGLWLINDKGVKQQVYYTHVNFYKRMKTWLSEYLSQNGKYPSREEFNSQAVTIF